MPSAFITSQAELLHRTHDTFLILQNLRDKYSTSSFPSQMSRVKDAWFEYEDRNELYERAYKSGYKYLKSQGISSKYLQQYKQFGEDGMKEQIQKIKIARKNNLTGSSRTDAAISQIKVLPDYMNDYRLSPEDITKNSNLVSSCVEKRSMDCINVEDANKLVSTCQHIVKSLDEDVFVTVAAMGIICGRRSIEILKLGEFSPSPRGSYACKFTGAAKKRGTCKGVSYDIPLLVKYKYFQRCLDHIRTEIPVSDLSNAYINSKYSHKLGDAAKIILESLNVKFHDLRAIYGTITHQVFSNSWSINIWLKKVLAHDNIDTSIYYSRCKIKNCTLEITDWN